MNYDTQDYVCSITPKEFEVFCLELLRDYAVEEGLSNFVINHDVKLKAYDGSYQIDVYASFTAMGLEYKILCECKQYKSKVKREIVQTLEGKIRSLGVHRGIILSTSGFQSGAITYAKEHGIALIQVYDHSCEPYSHSGGPDVVEDENDPLVYCEKHWPKYRAICIEPGVAEEVVVYPTRKMIEEIYHKMSILTKEMYEFELLDHISFQENSD